MSQEQTPALRKSIPVSPRERLLHTIGFGWIAITLLSIVASGSFVQWVEIGGLKLPSGRYLLHTLAISVTVGIGFLIGPGAAFVQRMRAPHRAIGIGLVAALVVPHLFLSAPLAHGARFPFTRWAMFTTPHTEAVPALEYIATGSDGRTEPFRYLSGNPTLGEGRFYTGLSWRMWNAIERKDAQTLAVCDRAMQSILRNYNTRHPGEPLTRVDLYVRHIALGENFEHHEQREHVRTWVIEPEASSTANRPSPRMRGAMLLPEKHVGERSRSIPVGTGMASRSHRFSAKQDCGHQGAMR